MHVALRVCGLQRWLRSWAKGSMFVATQFGLRWYFPNSVCLMLLTMQFPFLKISFYVFFEFFAQ